MNYSFNLLSQIASGSNMFSPSEQKMAAFILSNPNQVLTLSISELANACDTSVATVSRFCRRLSLNGYAEFRMELAKTLGTTSDIRQITEDAILPDDTTDVVLEKVYSIHSHTLTKAMEDLDPQGVSQAVTYLEEAEDVHFFGAGSMMLTALTAQLQFMQISPKFHCNFDIPIQAVSASLMTERSAAVVFSYTGSTRDVVEVAQIAKNRGAKLILVSRYSSSPLADIADLVLICGVSEGPLQMGSTAVRSGLLYIIDVLYTEYCRRFPEETQKNKELTSMAVIGKINPLGKNPGGRASSPSKKV